MTPLERQRVGRAVAARIEQIHSTVAAVARQAHVDPDTLHALIGGRRWPHSDTRARINEALGWPAGEMRRYATNGDTDCLERVSTRRLKSELVKRLNQR